MNKSPVIEYYRHPQTWQPIGCVIFINEKQFGWSQCNPNDHFSKKKAVEIALGRAKSARYMTDEISDGAEPAFRKILYFDENGVLYETSTHALFFEAYDRAYAKAVYRFRDEK